LKKQQGGDLLLICGTSLYTLLTEQHLIDEYLLYVCPSLAGGGKHLFSQLSDTLEVVFQKSVAFSSGMFLQFCKPIYKR
jgi:dihydrofolate reductase